MTKKITSSALQHKLTQDVRNFLRHIINNYCMKVIARKPKQLRMYTIPGI